MTGEHTEALRVALAVGTTARGGGERYLAELYRELEPVGITGTLVGSLPGWPEELAEVTVDLSAKWSRATALRNAAALRRDRRRLVAGVAGLSSPPDVIHAQYKREQILCSTAFADLAPVWWTEQGRLPTTAWTRPLIEAYRRVARRNVSGIVCVSDGVREQIRALLEPRSKVELVVIENAADTRRFRVPTASQKARARTQLGLADDVGGPVLCAVSRIDASKRVGLAVAVARENPELHLLVAGAGSQLDSLVSGAPDNVTFLGYTDRPELVYQAADVNLFCSDGSGEGFPLSLVEAAACGLPSVMAADAALDRATVQACGLEAVATVADFERAIAAVRSTDTAERLAAFAADHSLDSWRDRHEAVIRSVASTRR